MPRATTFAQFGDGYCSVWGSIFRAYGNPDTGSESVLAMSLDAAISAGDQGTVDTTAAAIRAELEAGRAQAAYASGWQPGQAFMTEMDRLLVAFEVMFEARRQASVNGLGLAEARRLGQEAFEKGGGVEAWRAMPEAAQPIASNRPSGQPERQCPGVPFSL